MKTKWKVNCLAMQGEHSVGHWKVEKQDFSNMPMGEHYFLEEIGTISTSIASKVASRVTRTKDYKGRLNRTPKNRCSDYCYNESKFRKSR